MTVTVRRATHEDLAIIVEFNLAMAAESEDRELVPEVLTAGVEHLLCETADGFYLMAEVDGASAGSLMVTYEWSDWRDGRFWWIQSVYVLPEFRRKAVYSKMHDWVRRAAGADGNVCGIRLYVEKQNIGAQATYRNLGMVRAGYDMYEEEFDRDKGDRG
ncbi:MAG: GNAT family N-acetyltransferase [Gammaproteobacteria bacterium]|nr:GNAT family N-acetyltransferase [Gammaproteobacteria bacterium]